MASIFDPFNTDEFGDPFSAEQERVAFGRRQAPVGGPQSPVMGQPTIPAQPVPAASSGPGFFTELFNPGSQRNAQILEMNRQRFLPGEPLADISGSRRQQLLAIPRNARRLIEAREAEERIRSRLLTENQRQILYVRGLSFDFNSK